MAVGTWGNPFRRFKDFCQIVGTLVADGVLNVYHRQSCGRADNLTTTIILGLLPAC